MKVDFFAPVKDVESRDEAKQILFNEIKDLLIKVPAQQAADWLAQFMVVNQGDSRYRIILEIPFEFAD